MHPETTQNEREAQRFAQDPPLYRAEWPELVNEADLICPSISEPHEPGHRLVQLLAYDAQGNEVARKRMGKWEPEPKRAQR